MKPTSVNPSVILVAIQKWLPGSLKLSSGCWFLLIFGLILTPANLVRGAVSPAPHQPRVSPLSDGGDESAQEDEFIYSCNFESEFDINFDDWPDGWIRQKGAGFPGYNPLAIQADPLDPTNRVLELGLNGGQAAIYSPAIKVNQQFSYRIRCRVNVPSRAEHACEAWASLTLLNADRQPVAVYRLPAQRTTEGWLLLESSLITIDHVDVTHAEVGLHVRPTEATSLFGKAYFDDITLQELPRLHLTFNNPLHVYIAPEDIRLTCQISGMRRSDADLRIELFNERQELLRSEVRPLNDESQVSKVAIVNDGGLTGYTVQQLTWNLVSPETTAESGGLYGYYRLVITLLDREANPLARELSFVVMPPESIGRETLFGCVFPTSIIYLDQHGLGATLQQLGVNWLKLPIWLDHQNQSQNSALGNLLQRLGRLEIDVIGILDEPPPRIYQQYWQHEHGIAALTNDVGLFLEAVQPLLIEWSLRIDRWQIGSDQDMGIAENLIAIDKMKTIKEHFLKYGEQTKVGLPWHWMMQRPRTEQQYWDFQSVSAEPPLTVPELVDNMQKLRQDTNRESYVGLQPLDRLNYDLATRVQELCCQMIEVKRAGFSRAYVPEPMHPHSGLFSQDNNPSEILLPWRTLAIHLNGATYLGQMELPNGSVNHWFAKGERAFAFVWSEQPTRETLYLGAESSLTDLWGRTESIDEVNGTQSFYVDQWPRLLQGADLSVALIRLSIQFDRTSLDNVSSQQQPLRLQFQNCFPHGVSGNVFLSNSDLFAKEVRLPFRAGRGETVDSTIPIQVRPDALTQQHVIQLEFKPASEELPPFNAWKRIRVGAEEIEFVTRQKYENNRFIVVVTMINRGSLPATYSVTLAPRERKHTSVTFYEVQPGQTSKSVVLYNADELLGTNVWMRARDEKGFRSMNYILKVE